jgi:DNA-binding NarL/FixJ family response regulator
MESTLPLITVVVMNRQKSVCEHWKQMFDKSPGMSCPEYAQDGKTAMALVSQLKPKVILIDSSLPDMSAEEAVTAIRQSSPKTVIVMYSEERNGANIARHAGADEFLAIPLPQKALVKAVEQAYIDHQE